MSQSTVFPADESALIVASGEICGPASDELRAAGAAKLAEASQHILIVDLAEVTFMDSSGLSALIALRNAAVASGSKLVLRAPSLRALRVLELSGMLVIFDVE
jgi:anti-sigma B factor antagonist